MSIVFDYKAIKRGLDRINGNAPTGARFEMASDASVRPSHADEEKQVRISDFVDTIPRFSVAAESLADAKVGDIDPRWLGITKEPASEEDMRAYYSHIEKCQAEAFFGVDLASEPDLQTNVNGFIQAPYGKIYNLMAVCGVGLDWVADSEAWPRRQNGESDPAYRNRIAQYLTRPFG